MKHLFTQFSFPGSIPNHVAPETPNSIHECVGWATLSRTPAAWHSTIPVWLWLVSLATAKRGQDHLRPGHSNKCLNQRRMALFCRPF